ncbi:heat shock 70 kDa protein 12B-like [Saccostrea echinata]|uniref:heat shock 70 kDa protein 12B-like n=1 Tax=Saccostrea echinata TaxID=191078 RepID=UPI002A8233A4|nr:heat shock 70 kDa protein 12B-like [Saccostrea echinata]
MSGLQERQQNVMSGLEERVPHEAISGLEEKQQPDPNSSSKMLVAAMDFGTTYSGYAFKFRHEATKKMYIKSWHKEAGSSCLPSEKAPTCVLLRANGEFKSFGYQAENEYSDIASEGLEEDWHFFRHFKMLLHNQEGLSSDTALKDSRGFEMPAKDIFTHCIKYMKDDLLEIVKKRKVDTVYTEDNILWVLTVPAIWEEPAKQFMREAAEKAGIEGGNLLLALEPEAASVYVKEMNVEVHQDQDMNQSRLSAFFPGTKYMIVDLGGGTVDVTVREVLDDRSLREITKASGGAWGGLRVNQQFYQYIEGIVGKEVMDGLKEQYPAAHLDLEREIEQKKRNLQGDENKKIAINLPGELLELFEENKGQKLSDFVNSSDHYKGRVDMRHEKLRFDISVTFSMFKPAVDSILHHIGELLSDPVTGGLQNIMLVGGFSDSRIIQRTVKERFKDFRVVIPQDAGLAVLKGAVLFGENPLIVSERVSRFTYGTKQFRYFLDGDPSEFREEIGGVPYCKNVFNVLAKSGQTFRVGQKVNTEVSPVIPDMTRMPVIFCQSNNPDQKYVDENCREIGTLLVDMPDTTGGLDRIVDVSLTFGDTELHVTGTDRSSGRNVSVAIELLKKK